MFHKGRLVQLDSHDQLVAERSGKYYELWNAQAQYYTESALGSNETNPVSLWLCFPWQKDTGYVTILRRSSEQPQTKVETAIQIFV